MQSFHTIGIMSGTSLDGVDIAYCVFSVDKQEKWQFDIPLAVTIPYPDDWVKRLESLHQADAYTYLLTDRELGSYIGTLANDFIRKHNLKVDLVASHGHTIFHRPGSSLTAQVGSGATIAAACRQRVVCDFRSLDVAMGGQGAPLVPIGDKYLFGEYDYCLNLGGIANISFDKAEKRIAYDICPCNMILNHLVHKADKVFDEDGELAKSGEVLPELLTQLNNLGFYKMSYPKSLGREWFNEVYLPVFDGFDAGLADKLATATRHIAVQISAQIAHAPDKSLLVTGGGALNKFLIENIKSQALCRIVIPSGKIVEFKEALIFAFLGVLRVLEKPNCLSSVTGAVADNIGGAVYFGNYTKFANKIG